MVMLTYIKIYIQITYVLKIVMPIDFKSFVAVYFYLP
jgi:hypothetical protein